MRTPPPTPVSPIRTPTTKPTRILSAITALLRMLLLLARSLGSSTVYANKALALQVQNDFLRRFFGREVASIDGVLGIGPTFVRIREAGQLLQVSCPRLGINSLSVALLADLH